MIPDTVPLVQLHELEFVEQQSLATQEKADALRATIDAQLLIKYDAVKARFGHNALVPMQEGSCSACHMALSSIKETQVSSEVVDCDFCGRLIYDPEIIYDSYLV